MNARTIKAFPALGIVALATLLPAAHAQSSKLDQVLSQMDAASAKFKSAQADVKQELFEKVVRDTTIKTGSIYFERQGKNLEMGARMASPAYPDKPQILQYSGGTLHIYDSGSKHLQTLHAGDKQAYFETFLTLGFGGSGHDLKTAWDITDKGTEKIDNTSVEELDLVSKDPGVRNNFTHVTVWVDPTRGITLKQEFFSASGDTKTATYTNIRYNANLDKKIADMPHKCSGCDPY